MQQNVIISKITETKTTPPPIKEPMKMDDIAPVDEVVGVSCVTVTVLVVVDTVVVLV